MDIKKAEEILSDAIAEDSSLHNLGWYIAWDKDSTNATLDGDFNADDLEAIACYMRAHGNRYCHGGG